MIVGRGDIATILKDREGFTFFASGVSNSQETRESEYKREEELLLSQDKKNHLVYFGSLAIFYSKTRYALHKRHMEDLVKLNFASYTIMRIGNITWGSNPNTLINFFKNKLKNNETFEIRDEFRYIIDQEEFLHWVEMIPEWNCEMNIPGKRMKVTEIVDQYCKGKRVIKLFNGEEREYGHP